MLHKPSDCISKLLMEKRANAIPILTHLGVELTGHTLREAVTNSDVHAEAVLALASRYPSAASTMMMDLTVEAEAFGAEVHFPENDMPDVYGKLIDKGTDVDMLPVPDIHSERIPIYLRANEIVAKQLDKPVLSGCIGPFSLAGRLYGMTEIFMGLFLEPGRIHTLLQKCTDFLVSYCDALKGTGTNGVIMAEPAAGLLSAVQCTEFSSNYVSQIVQSTQSDNFMIILHNCGNKGQCTSSMVDTHAAGLHFGNKVDMPNTLSQCPRDILVMGNLDPTSVFRMGTPDFVYEKTQKMLESCSSYDNFIISSGCDIPLQTPQDNIDAFFHAVWDFEKNNII